MTRPRPWAPTGPGPPHGRSAPVKVLGINAIFHDPSAALVIDGDTVAAAEEERFSRRKHGKRPVPFPAWGRPEQAGAGGRAVRATEARQATCPVPGLGAARAGCRLVPRLRRAGAVGPRRGRLLV